MSNSTLVEYTRLSPHNSGTRRHAIDRITPHCVVGQVSAESLGEEFAKPDKFASSNYGIDKDGRVAMYVDESCRAWTSSSTANDNRAVTIECASDAASPYALRDNVYERLVELCIDICKRHGKKKLLWLGSLAATEGHILADDEMALTVHRWFANTICPGEWLMDHMPDLAQRVTDALPGTSEKPAAGIQAKALKDMSPEILIATVGPLAAADMRATGVLASITLAQLILESGWAKSELAQAANNLFGMKRSLSGNTWPGSTWDGVSIYTKKTQEQEQNGTTVTITADFRKYINIEDSIADHSAYLLGAKAGTKARYEGLKGCKDYKRAAQIIKDGGYATSLTYVESLVALIEKWHLDTYDEPEPGEEVEEPVSIPIELEQVRKGDKGKSVWILRCMLRGRDYKGAAGKRLTRSKKFDDDCEAAVLAFQAAYGLDADGIVGPVTWRKLLGVA